MKKKQGQFPEGWDEERVRRLILEYEKQTEAEAVAEDEAAFDNRENTVMLVPKRLVPKIRKLIAEHRASNSASRAASARSK